MKPIKKVNSLEYLKGNKEVKDKKIERTIGRKLQIDEVFRKEEEE